MATEIERKFLLHKEKWDALEKPAGQRIRQGYISTDPNKTIRVRIKDDKAFITLKGKSANISRTEIETEIDVAAANQMLEHFAVSEIKKLRYEIMFGNKLWEVDVFEGNNEGLVLAEIELQSKDETFVLPDWIATEVSDDFRYYNSNLSLYPFNKW